MGDKRISPEQRKNIKNIRRQQKTAGRDERYGDVRELQKDLNSLQKRH